ncbi:hypothetical protein CEXT_174051 [Caerostris extrusa]|uniref:Uncharacterized protein n=1 Tax=Caerostris extrusa TaxID=172846 RepID=A0AAV4R8C0_CAEEX|nr:hypothetical protein CEXT_174051 [Caerostris extrusa]
MIGQRSMDAQSKATFGRDEAGRKHPRTCGAYIQRIQPNANNCISAYRYIVPIAIRHHSPCFKPSTLSSQL